jgi:polygalacturonase
MSLLFPALPRSLLGSLFLSLCAGAAFAQPAPRIYDVTAYGAKGDGQTLDSPAINKAIDAASAAGGGTVHFPAGTYLSFSVRLKSNITLQFDQGSTLMAAAASAELGNYDMPEPNEWGDKQYQDFGHSHWHNSLIWGENLENVSIIGPGRLDGTKGLSRNVNGVGGGGRRGGGAGGNGGGQRGQANAGAAPAAAPAIPAVPTIGNKAIALKLCRNVTIRDVSILMGGHFALLATGIDNFTLDNVKVDTNRDGFDIDACRNVRVSNCSVNAPNDDGIVLKSSFALGFLRPCENVTITNCQATGYDMGSFLDGTFKRTMVRAPDRDGPTGRIKFGTESNGGFKNITISNCVFDRSRGLALETVDGGPIEDITINNITMRDVSNSPIFIRLGNRARGPEGTPVATVRRITISNINASDVDPRYACLISGLPGHPIEDVQLSNIRILYKGGLNMDQVVKQPPELANSFFQGGRGGGPNGTPALPPTGGAAAAAPAPAAGAVRDAYDVPERENGYPEPSMFGILPAYGFFIRHAKNVTVERVDIGFMQEDQRPAITLMDVAGAEFEHIKAQRGAGAPFFSLRKVTGFSVRNSPGVADTQRATADQETL